MLKLTSPKVNWLICLFQLKLSESAIPLGPSSGLFQVQARVFPRLYNIKMRQTFSQLKQSFLGMVKRSTDTTDSANNQQPQLEASFYREWVQNGHTLTCHIRSVQRVPRMRFQRAYAVYVIEVGSDVGRFEVRKRYSQFQQFYSRCLQHAVLVSEFPPRTVLQFGWSEQVTTLRLTQLNKILSEIQSHRNKQLQLQLFSFLGVYEHCRHIKFSPTEGSLLATDEFLLLELQRLNETPANMLEGLHRIQISLSERKKRVGVEVARQLLGGAEGDGLVTLVLESMNELVVKQGLRLLNCLLSPETNKDWQVFRRVFSKCIPGKLVLEREQLRMSSEVGVEYFKLLSCYLSLRQAQDLHVVAQYYSQSARFEKEYERWAKYNNLSP